jgi:hypothetical protein
LYLLPIFDTLPSPSLRQAAISHPEDFTLVPLINLRPGSNVVLQKMSAAASGAEFAQSYASAKFPSQYISRYEEALLETARDVEAHR